MKTTVQQWINRTDPCAFKVPYPEEGDIVFGLVRYDSHTNEFCIYPHSGPYSFNVNAQSLLNSRNLSGFLLELHGKEWLTATHLKDFLDCLTCWCYRKYGRLPSSFLSNSLETNRLAEVGEAALF